MELRSLRSYHNLDHSQVGIDARMLKKANWLTADILVKSVLAGPSTQHDTSRDIKQAHFD
jgi:hypothetical protein